MENEREHKTLFTLQTKEIRNEEVKEKTKEIEEKKKVEDDGKEIFLKE